MMHLARVQVIAPLGMSQPYNSDLPRLYQLLLLHERNIRKDSFNQQYSTRNLTCCLPQLVFPKISPHCLHLRVCSSLLNRRTKKHGIAYKHWTTCVEQLYKSWINVLHFLSHHDSGVGTRLKTCRAHSHEILSLLSASNFCFLEIILKKATELFAYVLPRSLLVCDFYFSKNDIPVTICSRVSDKEAKGCSGVSRTLGNVLYPPAILGSAFRVHFALRKCYNRPIHGTSLYAARLAAAALQF